MKSVAELQQDYVFLKMEADVLGVKHDETSLNLFKDRLDKFLQDCDLQTETRLGFPQEMFSNFQDILNSKTCPESMAAGEGERLQAQEENINDLISYLELFDPILCENLKAAEAQARHQQRAKEQAKTQESEIEKLADQIYQALDDREDKKLSENSFLTKQDIRDVVADLSEAYSKEPWHPIFYNKLEEHFNLLSNNADMGSSKTFVAGFVQEAFKESQQLVSDAQQQSDISAPQAKSPLSLSQYNNSNISRDDESDINYSSSNNDSQNDDSLDSTNSGPRPS